MWPWHDRNAGTEPFKKKNYKKIRVWLALSRRWKDKYDNFSTVVKLTENNHLKGNSGSCDQAGNGDTGS
jgi:hypothetical protein